MSKSYFRGENATFFVTFLKSTGEDNPTVINPTILIKHFDGSSIIQDLVQTPLIQIGSSNQYYYNYVIPNNASFNDYVVIYNANVDGVDVEYSENYKVENFNTSNEVVSSNVLFINDGQSFEILKNTSKLLQFKIKDENLNPIDLTGLTGNFIAIKNNTDGTSIEAINKSLTIDIGTNGLCSVLLNNADTNIDINTYDFILKFNYGSGDDRVLGSGKLQILGNSSDRINEIKQRYSIDFKDYIIQNALDYSKYYINSYVYKDCEIKYNNKKTKLEIPNYVADSNFDGIIDINDLKLIQYTTVEPFVKTDLISHITSVNLNYDTGKSYIYLDSEYPSTDNTVLKISYKRSCFNVLERAQDFEKLQEFILFIYLFQNLTIAQLQRGILTRDINGISVTFDKDAINSLLINLKNNLNLLIYRLNGGACMNIGCDNNSMNGIKSVLINKGY